jgi:hypothetical protein
MASRRTLSLLASAPRDSAAWLRSQTSRERTLTNSFTEKVAFEVGRRFASLRVDRNDRLPSESVPLLP